VHTVPNRGLSCALRLNRSVGTLDRAVSRRSPDGMAGKRPSVNGGSGHQARLGTIVAGMGGMRYPLSLESRNILDDLGRLRTAARALLHEASLEARAEWKKLESRLPSDAEIQQGLLTLSKPELDEMRAKVRRFRDILTSKRGSRLPDDFGSPTR
jgi:hypothetical protein